LIDNRQRHVELLDHAIEAGENLCAMLIGDGRDMIRQQTGALQHEWDELFIKITSSQRQVEISLVEWTSYSDCVSQVNAWLVKMRTLVSSELPLVSTLEEKKAQLQTCKVTIILTVFLFQRLSIALQRGNVVAFLATSDIV